MNDEGNCGRSARDRYCFPPARQTSVTDSGFLLEGIVKKNKTNILRDNNGNRPSVPTNSPLYQNSCLRIQICVCGGGEEMCAWCAISLACS